jgi:tetratricopeptide (TPR) repeat protein/transcriptional regulator with XRE-family HTH domain
MTEIYGAGEWLRQRREALGLTRKALAELVACSPDTIKKIEGGIRRPSLQITQLLAEHLHIPEAHHDSFMRFVRGQFVPRMMAPHALLSEAQAKPDRYKVLARLEPLPEQKLFGVEAARGQVLAVVEEAQRPFLIALEGLGGLGKTTLANEVVHHFLERDRFADIGWVSAKQEAYVTGRGIQPTHKPALDVDALVDLLLVQLADGPYPISGHEAKRAALTQILKEKPCLIVVDNLETAVDYLTLLPLLRTLANPTKFLITSRMSLQNESDVFCYSLKSLSESDALAFLRHEATIQNVRPLLAASEQALQKIFQTVGGNPLALKLIIGQAHFLPLDHILENLRRAKEAQVDQLYAYIYWQAWQMLDENGRKLFLSLPVVPNGTFGQLAIASKLERLPLQQALTSLRTLSLLEVGGELDEPRYRLHRLTETFLLHEVLHWQEGEETAVSLSSETAVSDERHIFHERVQTMVAYWQTNHAIQQIDIETLDREKEGILKALHFGLTLPAAWPVVKALLLELSSYMERRGHWQAWQQTLEKGIEMAQQLADWDGEIRLTNLRGRTLQRQGDTVGVIRNYRRVIRLAKQTHNQVEEARACSNLGFAYIEKQRWWRSELLSCHALRIFDALGHQHGRAHTHNHLGLLYLTSSRWGEADEHLQTACRIWENENDQHGLLRGLANLGYLYNEIERPQEGVVYLQKALACVEQSGEHGEVPHLFLNLAVSYEKLGNIAQAEIVAKQAEMLYQKNANLLGVCNAWESLGRIYDQHQRPEKAEGYFMAALDGYRRLNHLEGQRRVNSSLRNVQNISEAV